MTVKRTRVRRMHQREDSAEYITTEEGWKHNFDSRVRNPVRSVDIVHTPLSRRGLAFTSGSGYISSDGSFDLYKFRGNFYCCFDYDSFSEYNELVFGTRSDGDK